MNLPNHITYPNSASGPTYNFQDPAEPQSQLLIYLNSWYDLHAHYNVIFANLAKNLGLSP